MDIREIENELNSIDEEYTLANDIAIYAKRAKVNLESANEDDEIAIAVAQEAVRNLVEYLGMEASNLNIEGYSIGYQYKLTLEGLGDAVEAIGGAITAVWDAIWGAIQKVFDWFANLFGGFDKKNKDLQKWVSEMTDDQKVNCTNLLEKMKGIAKGLRQAGTDKFNADANSIPGVHVDIAEYTLAYDPAVYNDGINLFDNVLKDLTGKYQEYLALANGADFIGKLQSSFQGIIKCDQIPQPYNAGLIQNYIKSALNANPATTVMIPTLETGKGVGIVFIYAGQPAPTTEQNNNPQQPQPAQEGFIESSFSYLDASYNFEDGESGTTQPGQPAAPAAGTNNPAPAPGTNPAPAPAADNQPANPPADNNQQPQGDQNQNNQQQQQNNAPKFSSSFYMFDSIGPYSAITTDISSLREHSVDTVIEHINKMGDWDKAMKDHTDRIKKIGEYMDKEMKKKNTIPDAYKNQVLTKGVGNGIKSMSVEFCNMVTRRKAAVEKIVKATLQLPGEQNNQNNNGNQANADLASLGPVPTEQDGKDKIKDYLKRMTQAGAEALRQGKNFNVPEDVADKVIKAFFKTGGTSDEYVAIVKELSPSATPEILAAIKAQIDPLYQEVQNEKNSSDNSGSGSNNAGNNSGQNGTQPQAGNQQGGGGNQNTGSFTTKAGNKNNKTSKTTGNGKTTGKAKK